MKKLAIMAITTSIINNSAQAIQTPEDLLPNGIDATTITNPYTGESGYARKGTVGAALANTHTLNQLLNNPPSAKNDALIKEVIEQHTQLLGALKVIGIFHLFTPEEWIADDQKQPGRCLLGLLYLQQYPQEMTPRSKKIIESLKQTSKNPYLLSLVAQ